MKKILLAATCLSLILINADAQVSITNWGSAQLTETFSDFSSDLQTGSSITLVGVEGNSYFGDLATPVSLSSISPVPEITLTGIWSGASTGGFAVELFDSNGNSRQYNGSFTSFTPSVSSTVTAAFAGQTGSFNNTVNSLGFTASGALGASVNLQLTNLTAVPESSTYALMALGGLVLFFIARRRKAQQA